LSSEATRRASKSRKPYSRSVVDLSQRQPCDPGRCISRHSLAWLLGAGFRELAAWWTVDLLRGIGRSSAVDTPSGLTAVRAALTAPALASGCTIVMAVGMGAMALMLG